MVKTRSVTSCVHRTVRKRVQWFHIPRFAPKLTIVVLWMVFGSACVTGCTNSTRALGPSPDYFRIVGIGRWLTKTKLRTTRLRCSCFTEALRRGFTVRQSRRYVIRDPEEPTGTQTVGVNPVLSCIPIKYTI